jgi:hypothetical protein
MEKHLQTVIDKIKGKCDDFAATCTLDEVLVTAFPGTTVIGAGFFIIYCT